MCRACLVVLLSLFAVDRIEAQGPVAEVEQIRFHSSFWQNLHVTLYGDARANMSREQSSELRLRRVQQPDQPLSGDLTDAERTAWKAAVSFYAEDLTRRDLRVGDGMTEIHWALTEPDGPPFDSDAIDPEHHRHLLAAAPVYRRHWWPEHDRAIRAWIDDVAGKIALSGSAVRSRLASLLETDWFSEPVRAEITYYGRAYTTLRPRPLTVIAMTDANYAGWAGAEMAFHEVSHALMTPMQARLEREGLALDKDASDLWHPVMFYLVGQVWRSELKERGVEYDPYLYATGLFGRAWSGVQGPIENNLRAYVDRSISADEAYRGLVSALPEN